MKIGLTVVAIAAPVTVVVTYCMVVLVGCTVILNQQGLSHFELMHYN